jgi:hypothetical protein
MEISFTPRPLCKGGGGTIRWTGGWVGPRAGLDAVTEEKRVPAPDREGTQVFQPVTSVTILTELLRLYITRLWNI